MLPIIKATQTPRPANRIRAKANAAREQDKTLPRAQNRHTIIELIM